MKHFRVWVIAVLGATLLAGCGDEGPQIDVESSVPVKVAAVTFKPIKEYLFATGTVQALHSHDMVARQQGEFTLLVNPRTGRPFRMGETVVKGDTIIHLVNQEWENQIALESKKLNHDISSREFEKQKNLYDKGGVTLRELTDAERLFIDARFAYDNARIQLDKLFLTAPFDGILVDLPYHNAGEMIAAGTTLGKIMDYARLYAEVTLPGKDLGRVTTGQSIIAHGYGESADSALGTVTQVSPVLDPISRMFTASLEINNARRSLRPGMFVRADIVVREKDSALVIPKEIIIEREGGKVVYVVNKGVADERQITLGLANPLEVEVVSGLEADDRVVVEGFETLRHRSRVKVAE